MQVSTILSLRCSSRSLPVLLSWFVHWLL